MGEVYDGVPGPPELLVYRPDLQGLGCGFSELEVSSFQDLASCVRYWSLQ